MNFSLLKLKTRTNVLAVLLAGAVHSTAGAQSTIVVGNGFTGPTSEPSPVGSPSAAGYDAKVIAAWDVVPYQTFTGTFAVGVAAFHMNGVERVDFAANGGPWTSITQVNLNPSTGVWEYWAVLNAGVIDDGEVEVRAIAYPKTAGQPRLLSYNYDVNGGDEIFSLTLHANGASTLPAAVRYVSPSGSNSSNGLTPSTAYATIRHAAQQIENAQGGDAGGGTIYLLPNQNWPIPDLSGIGAADRWLTICAAPGVDPDQVVFASNAYEGLPDGLLHVKNVKIKGPNTEFGGKGGGIWFEGVNSQGTDFYNDHGGFTSETKDRPQGVWCTESNFEHLANPLTRVQLCRNVTLNDIGNDLFSTPRHVINTYSINHATINTDYHSDFIGWASTLQDIYTQENFVFYNVASYDMGPGQGIYDDSTMYTDRDNVAFVNVTIDRVNDYAANGQWSGQVHTNHFLLWHCIHDNITLKLNSQYITNLSVRGCVWKSNSTFANYASDFENNHFVGTPYGANATSGDPMFLNEAANDYHPAPDSPLVNRVAPLLASADTHGLPRAAPASLGAFEVEGEVDPCAGDVNGNSAVNIDDMLAIFGAWGSCSGCLADVAPPGGNGVVGVDDLLAVIMSWGPCPAGGDEPPVDPPALPAG